MKSSGSEKKKAFDKMVQTVSPKPKLAYNCIKAFFVGGAICIFGQIITKVLLSWDMSKSEATTLTSMILIFLGALFTGLDLYDSLGEFAGAGSIIPITGFANSIVSPAMEFKKEGYVLGVGAKMFTIAGPVIVYGVISSVVVGLIYYFIS